MPCPPTVTQKLSCYDNGVHTFAPKTSCRIFLEVIGRHQQLHHLNCCLLFLANNKHQTMTFIPLFCEPMRCDRPCSVLMRGTIRLAVLRDHIGWITDRSSAVQFSKEKTVISPSQSVIIPYFRFVQKGMCRAIRRFGVRRNKIHVNTRWFIRDAFCALKKGWTVVFELRSSCLNFI